MAARFAAIPGFGRSDGEDASPEWAMAPAQDEADYWNRFGAPAMAPSEWEEIAMTRGQARNIINRLTSEALRGNITPNAYQSGMQTLSQVATSPDFTRRTIRNTLATPGARLALENPQILTGLASQSISKYSGELKKLGINPGSLNKFVGPTRGLLEQIQSDNLLRSNVTNNEIAREVQQPMYGAMQDWVRANVNNKQLHGLLEKAGVGLNDQWGPQGQVPIVAGFKPEDFGIGLTPQARQTAQAEERRRAAANSPAGRRQAEADRRYGEELRRSLQRIQARVNAK